MGHLELLVEGSTHPLHLYLGCTTPALCILASTLIGIMRHLQVLKVSAQLLVACLCQAVLELDILAGVLLSVASSLHVEDVCTQLLGISEDRVELLLDLKMSLRLTGPIELHLLQVCLQFLCQLLHSLVPRLEVGAGAVKLQVVRRAQPLQVQLEVPSVGFHSLMPHAHFLLRSPLCFIIALQLLEVSLQASVLCDNFRMHALQLVPGALLILVHPASRLQVLAKLIGFGRHGLLLEQLACPCMELRLLCCGHLPSLSTGFELVDSQLLVQVGLLELRLQCSAPSRCGLRNGKLLPQGLDRSFKPRVAGSDRRLGHKLRRMHLVLQRLESGCQFTWHWGQRRWEP
mmetsp:Transcript_97351/g.186673  ORF Transcript_97351/g.186673 Transcript_97351/m.186673 type:complete len:345 (-) Transcript_97351:700-1734(-)